MSNYSEQVKQTFFPDNPAKTRNNRKQTPMFSLRVSEAEKYANDKQWFKDYMQYILPSNSAVIDDYEGMKVLYEVYNNNLSGFRKQLEDFCNPLGENLGNIEEEILPYPKLHTKVNLLKGEMLKRNDNFIVNLQSPKVFEEKNMKLRKEIQQSVEEKLNLIIEEMRLQEQGLPPEQVQQQVAEMRSKLEPKDILKKNFLSEWEIFYNNALRFGMYEQHYKMLKQETTEDAVIVDRFFVYSGWRFGKPYFEIRNPLYCGWLKDPNEMYVNKGDYFWYKKPISIADVYNTYGHILDDNDIERLGVYTHVTNISDKRHSVIGNEGTGGEPVFDHTLQEFFNDSTRHSDDKRVGTHQGAGINRKHSKDRFIWETHIEFKAFRKVIFLSYNNDRNKRITEVVPDSFEIPKEAENEKFLNSFGNESIKSTWLDKVTGVYYEAEELWIPRKYEVIRLGNDIFPIVREVPFQTINTEEPYSGFNLSTFGAIFTSRNAKSVSLLERALPYYFQYIYVKHIQNRELAKYQGYIQDVDVDQIPQELGKDINGELIKDPVAVWMMYRKKTGVNFYSGSQNSLGGLPPATRSPGSQGHLIGTAQEIFVLQQLLQMIETEMGLAMGIPPQREAQVLANTNVSDNQQALVQSSFITEPYFFYINEIWKQLFEDYLKNFRTYCERVFDANPDLEEHSLSYILPDGSKELFTITKKMLEPIQMGIFVTDSGRSQEYSNMMMNMAHAFAQNAGEGMEAISTLVKTITSGASPEEIHKLLSIEAQNQQQRAEKMQQMQLESQEKMAQANNRMLEDAQQHDIAKIDRTGEWSVRVASLKNNDETENGESPELSYKREIDDKKLQLEQQKLAQKDKELSVKTELENKKIKTKSTQK
jgi:hypothetical protein